MCAKVEAERIEISSSVVKEKRIKGRSNCFTITFQQSTNLFQGSKMSGSNSDNNEGKLRNGTLVKNEDINSRCIDHGSFPKLLCPSTIIIMYPYQCPL